MSARIEDLEPITRAMCEAFLADADAIGAKVRVTHTYRTLEEQAHLYAKGRTLPGPIVTRAKPGESAHNWRMAFDICQAEGEPYPDPRTPEGRGWWMQLGRLGRTVGLYWGGDFKSIRDYPHFERPDWRAARGTA